MNKNELFNTIKDKFLNEGAYSNGRYEHPEGKQVNKYHPGHANPIYTHTRYENGDPHVTRWADADPDGDVSQRWRNPMNAKYAKDGGHGKDGTGTNYRKGEIPNGYMIWTREDERARKEAWDELMEIISSAADGRYKDDPSSAINKYRDGMYRLPTYMGNSCPFNKIQLLRIKKALAKFNVLELRKDRTTRNNEKYDDSRSDSQIKKDARLWAKDKEEFDYKHNHGPEPVQTQSKAFRKKVNGDIIRNTLWEKKYHEQQEEKKARKEHIEAARKENEKQRWSPEAFKKREERRKAREE